MNIFSKCYDVPWYGFVIYLEFILSSLPVFFEIWYRMWVSDHNWIIWAFFITHLSMRARTIFPLPPPLFQIFQTSSSYKPSAVFYLLIYVRFQYNTWTLTLHPNRTARNNSSIASAVKRQTSIIIRTLSCLGSARVRKDCSCIHSS